MPPPPPRAGPVLQKGVAVPAQFASAVHWTHVDVAVSQWGVAAAHWLSAVQPARHVNVSGLHTGAAVPQSELPTHSTQVPFEARQRGAAAGQSELPAHSTHVCVVVLQTFAAAGQSVAVLHPTQTPAAVSQMVAARPVHWASVVHAAWQVCVPGKQAGVVPVPQSVFDSHATQLP
jgi:hypothetical protein